MVKLKVPLAVDGPVFTVSGVLTCPPVAGTESVTGEHAAPVGNPEQLKDRKPLNPGCGLTYAR